MPLEATRRLLEAYFDINDKTISKMENNEILVLTAPTDDDFQAFSEYKEEFIKYGEDYLAGPEYTGHSDTFLYKRESDNKIIGTANIRPDASEYGNIGYAIRPSERGRGYGDRIVDSIISLCDFLGMKEVVALCYESNAASRYVLEENGFIKTSERYDASGRKTIEYRIKLGENDD